jgi:Predicted membrane protein
MKLFLLIVVCSAITFLLRYSFIAASKYLPKDPRFHDMLRFVPPAVLAALIAPEIFVQNENYYFDYDNLRIWAAALAFLVAYFTRNVLATIASGMVALWCLQSFL